MRRKVEHFDSESKRTNNLSQQNVLRSSGLCALVLPRALQIGIGAAETLGLDGVDYSLL